MDHEPAQKRQQGQVMVLFLLAIFAIIGMVGLVLDGGSWYTVGVQVSTASLQIAPGNASALNISGIAPRAPFAW